MYVSFSTGLRQGLLTASGFQEIFANGTAHVYSGSPPANADAAVTGTLLGKITKSGLTFTPGSPTNGINFDAPVAGTISKAAAEVWQMTGLSAPGGIAGYLRLMGNAVDSLGVSTTLPRIDLDIGNAGTAILMSNVQIDFGAPSSVDSLLVTFPAS